MAKRRNQILERVDFKDIVWCIDNLSVEQMKAHDAKPYNPEQILNEFNKMIEMGFTLSLKTDKFTGNMQISAVCYDAKAHNAGLAMSARSDDTVDMCSILIWKFFNVADGDLKPFADQKPRGVRG